MTPLTLASTLFAVTALLVPSYGAPTSFQMANALAAQKLNAQFASLNPNDACTGEQIRKPSKKGR